MWNLDYNPQAGIMLARHGYPDQMTVAQAYFPHLVLAASCQVSFALLKKKKGGPISLAPELTASCRYQETPATFPMREP